MFQCQNLKRLVTRLTLKNFRNLLDDMQLVFQTHIFHISSIFDSLCTLTLLIVCWTHIYIDINLANYQMVWKATKIYIILNMHASSLVKKKWTSVLFLRWAWYKQFIHFHHQGNICKNDLIIPVLIEWKSGMVRYSSKRNYMLKYGFQKVPILNSTRNWSI